MHMSQYKANNKQYEVKVKVIVIHRIADMQLHGDVAATHMHDMQSRSKRTSNTMYMQCNAMQCNAMQCNAMLS